MLKVIKLDDGTYQVQSRSNSSVWIVSRNLTTCNCPKFKYILHGQGTCHHIESAMEFLEGEELKNNTPIMAESGFNPDEYKTPIPIDTFAEKYGDNQLALLKKLQVVIEYRGLVRLLK